MSSVEVYRDIASMEPMLPDLQSAELAELNQKATLAIGELNAHLPSPVVRDRVSQLVRKMNCYYSNLIEGHKTLPRDIEQAGERQLAEGSREERDKQLLAEAHIQTEAVMTERLNSEEVVNVYSPEFICWIHQTFFERLPESMREARTRSGETYQIIPGQMRDFMVDVGRHTPPDHAVLPEFLERFRLVYGNANILATQQLAAIAAAHHRLTWIHPFGDGNGRVIRLHSHALFHHHNLHGHGLWTLSRGLARNRQRYFNHLQAADHKRENDFDGRGNLSARQLSAFCLFFLETVLDQVNFMNGLLNLKDLHTRIEKYFRYEALHLGRHQEAIGTIVTTLAYEGEIPRERVKTLTGKGATTVASIIKQGLSEGYFTSPSPKGVLQFAIPENTWSSYFPQLFIDLPEKD
ncbi:MAG: Fic family protein [Verrucomicrobiales bacterium]|nr:Fic family protein [Verrucomicrobiales bacterium]